MVSKKLIASLGIKTFLVILLVFTASKTIAKNLDAPDPPTDEECRLVKDPNTAPDGCGAYNSFAVKNLRIKKGDNVMRGEIPWFAYLPKPGCGATIIDESHLLTAARCIKGEYHMIGKLVVVGNIDKRSNSTESECTAQVRHIKSVEAHPCFCDEMDRACYEKETRYPRIPNQYSAAIITVDKPFLFNRFVRPICLPESNAYEITNGDISGFGAVDKFYDDNGDGVTEFPLTLQKATIPIASREKCEKLYGNIFSSYDSFCAGSHNESHPVSNGRSYFMRDKNFP